VIVDQTAGRRMFGRLPLFDPSAGVTVLEPTGHDAGYWVGAPGVIYDDQEDCFYLYYRVREPRPVRGKECRIAASKDGEHFEDIWEATQSELGTSSMERGCLFKSPDGEWRLYISYVDPDDKRWRIDLLESEVASGFDVSRRAKVLTAEDIDAEGVKDPWVCMVGHLYYMLASYAPKPDVTSADETRMHGTGDVYATGLTKSSTGLALSEDGIHWSWQGEVFAPSEEGWDSWAARLGCLVYVPPVFIGFYDGAADVSENYEERCGLAVTTDLRSFRRVTVSGPALTSPHVSGCVRYVDGVYARGAYWFYYEFARPDGSHELRMSKVVVP